MPASQTQRWTTRTLLAWMAGHFEKKGVDSPRLTAEYLLAHVLQCERLRLYMDADRPASPAELQTLRALVARAAEHEPIAYLLGQGWFFGLPFRVSPATLIPRPSTEVIVEEVLQSARHGDFDDTPLRLADVCTGSGAIAVVLAHHLGDRAALLATDISPDALTLAAENAAAHAVTDRIEFLHGSLLDPLRPRPEWGRLHFLLANPPYVSDPEWEALDRNVRDYEPPLALRGGPDGLDLIRPLIEEAPEALRSGGMLALECSSTHADAVLELGRAQASLTECRLVKDLEGFKRVLVARRA